MQTAPVLLNLCDQLAVATKKAPTAKARQWAERLRAIFYRACSFHAEVLEFSNRASLPKVLTDKYKAYIASQLNGLASLEETVRILAREIQTSFTEATEYIVQERLQAAYVALRNTLRRATRTVLEPQYAPRSYCVSPKNNSCLKAFPFYRTEPLPVAAPKKRAAKAPARKECEPATDPTLIERIAALELALKEVQIQLHQLQLERSSP